MNSSHGFGKKMFEAMEKHHVMFIESNNVSGKRDCDCFKKELCPLHVELTATPISNWRKSRMLEANETR